MDILKSSQLVIFSHSTIFITFSYRSLAGFLFKLLRSSRRRKPEVALDLCVWPLCGSRTVLPETQRSDHAARTRCIPCYESWEFFYLSWPAVSQICNLIFFPPEIKNIIEHDLEYEQRDDPYVRGSVECASETCAKHAWAIVVIHYPPRRRRTGKFEG